VTPENFNSYGARRGNHEVMMRGTFGNVRLKNLLTAPAEGSYTLHLPDEEKLYIYDAAMKYQQENTGVIVIAGKEYGAGSSRDWAAKGSALLGIRAVIAVSYERIHRSNLIGMGVLPLQFIEGENRESLGLTGKETYTIEGLKSIKPGQKVKVKIEEGGTTRTIETICRLDTDIEVTYLQNQGIMPYVLRKMIRTSP
jgi:aconitate hydratase